LHSIAAQTPRAHRRKQTIVERAEHRAKASLDWLSANLDRFSPIGVEQPGPKLKALSELAILYDRLRAVTAPRLRERLLLSDVLRRWRQFLVKQCEHRSYAELGRRLPAYAVPLLLPYMVLRPTGYTSPFHEETVRTTISKGFLFFEELLPYRQLDRSYFLWKAGLLPAEPDWPDLYAKTTLATAPDVLHLDRDAAYAITHTLFYLTDWGRRAPTFAAPEIERVTSILDCLAIHYWRLQHWDLLGELLANRMAVQPRKSHLIAAATSAFLKAWRPEGCIPGEGVLIPGLDSASAAERDEIIFRECYHATLVGVLVCAGVLENGGV